MMPHTGDITDLANAVGCDRGRHIQLLPFELGTNSPTGLWIATTQADYVVYPINASAAERVVIICHELSHMLLHHEPVGGADQLSQMAVLAAPNVDPAVARRFLARHGYAQEIEAEAETLATVLVTDLTRRAERHAMIQDDVSDRLR